MRRIVMEQITASQNGFFNLRFVIVLALFSAAVFLSILSLAANPTRGSRDEVAANPATPLVTGPGWSPVTSLNVTATASQDVACTSSSDCWIVGNFYDGTTTIGRPMTEHWNGVAWSVVPVPAAATTFSNKGVLEGVACASATQCWAVGEFQTGTGVQQPLIEHWDGNMWSIVPANTSTTQPNYLTKVTCNSASDCWAAGAINPGSGYVTLIVHWNGTAWSVVASPNPVNSSAPSFTDITCLATNNCWAVGNFTNTVPAVQTLVEHWDGTSWVIVPSPNMSVTQDSVFLGISCVSATDCWAVGAFFNGNNYQTLTEHWDGGAWSIIGSPNTSTTEHNILYSTKCNSGSDCLAVGFFYDSNGFGRTLTQHWNGTAWSIVSSPNASPDNYIYGIACSSAADCWAVGYFNIAAVDQVFLMRWNGSSWSSFASANIGVTGPTATNVFSATSCISALDCWAVGSFDSGSVRQTLTAHWNGNSWAIISSPNTSLAEANVLNAVTCRSTSDCWTAGFYQNGSGIPQTLIEHWNGNAWSIVDSPNTSISQDNQLIGVACISANDCAAVGSFINNNGVHQTLALRWNGTAWAIVSSPNSAPNQDNQFAAVACVAAECWAVGHYTPSTVAQVLIQKWNGSTWSIFPSTNTSSMQDNFLNGVACPVASQCIAVGTFINGGINRTLVEQWNSISTSIVSSPNSDSFHNNTFHGLNCTSLAQCWAVGEFENGNGVIQPLIEQWDGTNWIIVPSNNSFTVDSFLNHVSCSSAAQCWGVGARQPGAVFETMLTAYAPTTPPLGSVSSRLAHGTMGKFDVDLPQTGPRGVECRSGGASNNYSLVFSFANNLTSVGSVAGSGTGSVTSSALGPSPNQYTVNITGLTNTNNFTATLNNVVDAQGNTGNVASTINVLLGDVTGNGSVNSGDVAQTKSRVGQSVDVTNSRSDVNVNGSINASDVSIVKSKIGTGLP